MNAEFQWWLLILGIVIGGALVYLVMADLRADEDDDDDVGDAADDDRDDDTDGDIDEGEPRGDDAGLRGDEPGPR